ncbi:hypothetical protein I3842_04G170500 [Carya illinoinensis]|uniref:peroxidase n=1 Tax=Carya illinoinensis TaxID=32201 RepID=A0A922JVM4_CARIL|nr:hypothetical protein I3842_04G170500 [Carya illinoinensis]
MEAIRFVFLVILVMSLSAQSQLKTGFYSTSCPRAEAIVKSTVEEHFNKDPTIAAGLLRLHFHDCFVQGCDGSVLITGSSAERNALPNLGFRGFNSRTPWLSTAQYLCITNDGPSWSVPTGRRDGRVYLSSQASNLPSPCDSIAAQRQKFDAKGHDDHDLVTLVGAHTIGQTDCLFFRYRLYNFTATGNSDPTINQAFLSKLQALCPKGGDGSKRVALDDDSQTKFDVSFFKNLRDGKAVLESDQRLWRDAATRSIVQNYAGSIRGLLGLRFNRNFPKAMIKMSSIEVKTGTQGEIRKVCSKFN